MPFRSKCCCDPCPPAPCMDIYYSAADLEIVLIPAVSSGITCPNPAFSVVIDSTLKEYLLSDPGSPSTCVAQVNLSETCSLAYTGTYAYTWEVQHTLQRLAAPDYLQLNIVITYRASAVGYVRCNQYTFRQSFTLDQVCSDLLTPMEIPLLAMAVCVLSPPPIDGDPQHPQIDKVLWNLST